MMPRRTNRSDSSAVQAARDPEAGLRAEMARLRMDLIKWGIGTAVAGVLAVGGMLLAGTLFLLHVLPHG
jgi:hypothetical protein